jgi:hypothetical protein
VRQTWYAKNDTWQRLGHTSIPPGTGPTPKPLVGAATSNDTALSFSDLEAQVGTLAIRRSYAGPGVFPATYAASTAGIDAGVRESMWSFKPTPAAFAAGDHDAWFNAFLTSVPVNQKVIFILWHEPEDNIRNGEFTLSDWKTANNHLGQLVHATGRAELRTAVCLLGAWTFTPGSPYYSTDYWDSGFTTNIDYIGLDPYNTTNAFLNLGDDANFVTAMNWATVTHDKQVVLSEFGCIDAVDPTRKANWITASYDYAISSNMYAICYFNISGSQPLTTSESIAAYSNANADSKI